MKLTDEEFKKLFGDIAKPQQVIGYSHEDNEKWNGGYSFAINQVYDVLVTNGTDDE